MKLYSDSTQTMKFVKDKRNKLSKTVVAFENDKVALVKLKLKNNNNKRNLVGID